jgi:hypothetical protein
LHLAKSDKTKDSKIEKHFLTLQKKLVFICEFGAKLVANQKKISTSYKQAQLKALSTYYKQAQLKAPFAQILTNLKIPILKPSIFSK